MDDQQRPAGVEQFYTPPSWRVVVTVGGHELVRRHPAQGHHLAAAASELLQLYTGANDSAFGMLDPRNDGPIVVTIERLPDEG